VIDGCPDPPHSEAVVIDGCPDPPHGEAVVIDGCPDPPTVRAAVNFAHCESLHILGWLKVRDFKFCSISRVGGNSK